MTARRLADTIHETLGRVGRQLMGARLRETSRGISHVLRRIRSVSFSLYGEDLLLSHMQPLRTGFYVDVGAFHPTELSNTYKLYLKGWSGVTIEPNPDAAPRFRMTRPRDQHLTLGIADSPSTLTYFKFRDSAQNTFDAAHAVEMQLDVVGEVEVRCMPLNDVFEQYCRDRQVDLLDVDCEFRDLQVLESLDFRHHRPTVIIVEDFEQFDSGRSFSPGSSAIRSFLLNQDYAVAAQAIFSFFYVDRRAFAGSDRDSGFRLSRSQLEMLRSS